MFLLCACCDADRQRQRLCRLNAIYTRMQTRHVHAYIRERIIFSVCFRILTTAAAFLGCNSSTFDHVGGQQRRKQGHRLERAMAKLLVDRLVPLWQHRSRFDHQYK
jgi:hypothetical protein